MYIHNNTTTQQHDNVVVFVYCCIAVLSYCCNVISLFGLMSSQLKKQHVIWCSRQCWRLAEDLHLCDFVARGAFPHFFNPQPPIPPISFVTKINSERNGTLSVAMPLSACTFLKEESGGLLMNRWNLVLVGGSIGICTWSGMFAMTSPNSLKVLQRGRDSTST
jgi:hypothetical protein